MFGQHNWPYIQMIKNVSVLCKELFGFLMLTLNDIKVCTNDKMILYKNIPGF